MDIFTVTGYRVRSEQKDFSLVVTEGDAQRFEMVALQMRPP